MINILEAGAFLKCTQFHTYFFRLARFFRNGNVKKCNAQENGKSLICTLCLEVFRDPRLLPCHHSFCLDCLANLTSRHHLSRTFPCPQCRHQVTLPPGGVTAFQSKFYIDAEDLEKARDGTQCLTHPQQDLDLYCVDCQVPVCFECVLTKHKPHQTQELSEAAGEASIQLSQDEVRLQDAVSQMMPQVEAARKEQQALREKTAAVETQIRTRHAVIVAAADKFRDEELASLNSVTQDMDSEAAADLAGKQEKLDTLLDLQQELEGAVSDGSGCGLLNIARVMKVGQGSPQFLQELTSEQNSSIRRPVLHYSTSTGTLLQAMRGFFGPVAQVQTEAATPEVTVEDRFRCEGEKHVDVFSLCCTDDNIVVSYEWHGLQEDEPCEEFSNSGTLLRQYNDAAFLGKCSLQSRMGKDINVAKARTGWTETWSKSHTATALRLDISPTEGAFVSKQTEMDTGTGEYDTEVVFNIDCKHHHRAFDADDSERLLAVVELDEASDARRWVRLYTRSYRHSTATYAPPTQRFLPSDVCFFGLGDREVLLIADELNDAIHVVGVTGGRLEFLRYLAPGCPLLVQPTALNTDRRGDLWVACRGGSILRMQPTRR